jgi:hypothetical protein
VKLVALDIAGIHRNAYVKQDIRSSIMNVFLAIQHVLSVKATLVPNVKDKIE